MAFIDETEGLSVDIGSQPLPETARKIASEIRRGLASYGQAPAARAIGVSESTVSRLVSEHLDNLARILALLELKVVPSTDITVDPERMQAYRTLAKAYLDEER